MGPFGDVGRRREATLPTYSTGSEPIFITSCPAPAFDVKARVFGGMAATSGGRSPRGCPSFRGAICKSILWIMIVAVVLAPLNAWIDPASPPHFAPRASALDSGSGTANGASTHSDQLSRALQSLEAGSGPASGETLRCSSGNEGESGSCESVSSSPGHSKLTSVVAVSNPISSWGALAVYDAADGYVLVYGGTAGDHTWTYTGGTWTELKITTYPASRTEASMTYDAVDHEVILFGGEYHPPKGPGTPVGSVSYYSDTWAFHGGAWSNITNPLDSPPGRYYAMMTYDAADGYVLLFGGDYAKQFLGDTWTFKGGTWTNMTAANPSGKAPSCRIDGGIAFDVATGYVVLFGGTVKAGGVCLNGARNVTSSETWAFSRGTWTNLSPAVSPPARWAESLVYDASGGSILMFGGLGASDTSLTDTWTFSDGNWTQLPLHLYPPGRFSASMAYDPSTGLVLMFGGLSEPQRAAPILSDFWEFTAGSWLNLTLIPSPPPARNMSLAFDGKDGYVLLFGGQNQSGGYLNQTWRFVGGVWLLLTPPTSPSARSGASMVYDAAAGYVVLFGGTNGSARFNDTWAYFKGNWIEVNTSLGPSPPARYAAGIAYDPSTSEVILFGGNGTVGDLADTWEYQNISQNGSTVNGTWSPLSPLASPPAREGAEMAYLPPERAVVLFGGEGSAGFLGDSWQYSGGNWTELTPPIFPSPRMDAAFTYDTNDGFALLFGGLGASGPLNDTWAFLNGVWTNLTPWSPAARGSAGMAYDSLDASVVLFGGSGTAGVLGDTWRFEGGNWSQLLPLPTPPPHGTTTAKGSSKVLEYVTIGVGLAAVACLVIYLAVRRGRGKSPAPLKPSSQDASSAERTATPTESPIGPPTPGKSDSATPRDSGRPTPASHE